MTRVLVTRPAAQASELTGMLAARGIDAVAVPTVAIAPASDGALERALRSLDDAAWLVVTSANGAEAVLGVLSGRALPPALRVAAVGPATAGALRAGGIRVDHVPDRYLTVAIADGLGDVAGRRIVLARADAATAELHDVLRGRGAIVDEVIAYRTIEGPPSSRDPLGRALALGLDGILFTSGSTVRGLGALVPSQMRQRVTAIPAYCIGPVTATVAMHAGFRVAAVSDDHTAEGLAEAVAGHLRQENR